MQTDTLTEAIETARRWGKEFVPTGDGIGTIFHDRCPNFAEAAEAAWGPGTIIISAARTEGQARLEYFAINQTRGAFGLPYQEAPAPAC